MKKIMIVFLAAASLVAVGGCKKKNGFAEAMAKMTEFKDKMCNCTKPTRDLMSPLKICRKDCASKTAKRVYRSLTAAFVKFSTFRPCMCARA